ncbi:hypothetical protein DB313_05650 (plasmid) [Borrelia turcica IST7]|uniref:Chromosome replication/partitioning protein n=1 Tax=Borrelia turcica IST7 TaxID=1104446 RepID=A0A386PQ26_9SPIR|nr:chromosome replication/partitioning protein [Borrelia turcica]AYE36983.1 hypothetical protein DB313_05650 [Borrelia turcica IST7]
MKIDKNTEIIQNRIIDNSVYDERDKKKNRFNELVNKLKLLEKRDISNKIEAMKILAEIYDDGLYIIAGYRQFGAFAKTCFISGSRVYIFVRIGQKLREGVITEQDIINNGINYIREIIQKEDYKALREGENKTKSTPLRIMLPSDTAYSYFKSNTKFTSYALARIYDEHRQLLDNLFYEYNQEKKQRRIHDTEDIIEAEEEQQTVEEKKHKKVKVITSK